MLDNNLAELYQVGTKVLNQAIRRNKERFPSDFMFQLNREEVKIMNRSQFVTGSQKHRDPRFLPYAFTEQGVAMLSSVLNSKRAIAVNIAIMRAFVKLRQIMSGNKQLTKEIEKLETAQKRQSLDIAVIFHVIKKLIKKDEIQKKQKIGFRV